MPVLIVGRETTIGALQPRLYKGRVTYKVKDTAIAALRKANPGEAHSVARAWNEELLDAIRIDRPKPPVHGRNLFHLSVAMWDAWVCSFITTCCWYVH